MVEIKMFQEIFHKLVIDSEGNITVVLQEEDLENIIEELEGLRKE